MKTELIHSYSSVSLSGLSRSTSQVSLNGAGNNNVATAVNGKHSTSAIGLISGEDGSTCVEVIKEWSKNTFRKKILYKKVPCLDWIPKYNVNKAICDVIAGLTVGLTILPQALAYASLTGLPPQVTFSRTIP
jgi:sodium-independent sulfate anion transporter 11